MMKVQSLIALLLTCALAGTAHTPAGAQEGGPGKCISSGDECDAAKLAVRLVKRLEETGDAGPVAQEFFPPDFAERLQKFLRDGNFSAREAIFAVVSRDVITRAEAADLRRAYIAAVNAWHHFNQFGGVISDLTEARHPQLSHADEAYWRLRSSLGRGALPPAFFETRKSDPMLAIAVSILDGESKSTAALRDGDESGDDATLLAEIKASSIRDVERLRSFTEKLEKCVALLREATQKLREELKACPGRAAQRTTDLDDVYRVKTKTYTKEAFGFPAGTPFISARLHPYVVVMVPIERQLKVIAILPDFNGD